MIPIGGNDSDEADVRVPSTVFLHLKHENIPEFHLGNSQ